jgi:hypothetical protein
MIDTLRLNLIDCEIKKSCPLSIQQGTIDYSTGKIHNESDLFIDNYGKIVRGSKAYLNDEKFNLTIQPTVETELNDFNKSKLKIKRFKRIDETIQPDIFDWESDDKDVKGIFLSTSLPRLLSETNLKTLSFDEQKSALKILETKLRYYGIKTNIFDANLSRVDTFTNLKTEFPFYSYSNLFSLMECSRMKSVGYADESFLFKNGNQQLAIYDKVLEMKFKNPKLNFLNRKNIMRIENRLLKRRAIDTKLHFIKLDDIYKNYDEVKEYHKKEIGKKLFKYDLDEIDFKTTNMIESSMRFCKDQFGNKWFENFFVMEGMKQIIKVMDLNNLLGIVEDLDNDKSEVALRKKKSRIRKKYNDFKFYVGMLENKTRQGLLKSNVDLYNELKTKFYKEVA